MWGGESGGREWCSEHNSENHKDVPQRISTVNAGEQGAS